MSKENKAVRYVFIRNDAFSVGGFTDFAKAKEAADAIPESETVRVRVRFRNRTGMWDVVVKTRREAKEETPKAAAPAPAVIA